MKKKRMNKWTPYLILLIVLGLLGCKGTGSDQIPATSPSQSKAVFTEFLTPLEGTWKGRILTYSDPRGQVDEAAQPKDITPKTIIARPTKTEKITSVTRTFTNEGEFDQRVKVVEQVKGKQIYTNHGIRQVEDGVITSTINTLHGVDKKIGYKDEDNNFVWIREQQNPKIVEFFKHIKKDNKIRVIGWGYYGDDDLTKAPKIWYFGDIKKVEESESEKFD